MAEIANDMFPALITHFPSPFFSSPTINQNFMIPIEEKKWKGTSNEVEKNY